MNLNFEKWSGAGNDFILIDLRDFEIRKSLSLWKKTQSELAIALCRRTHSLGADGLIFLFETQGQPEDLTWEFYNADGSTAEMCGNAARCVGAYELRKSGRESVSIQTASGRVGAQLVKESKISVSLKMPVLQVGRHEVSLSKLEAPVVGAWIDSGVPHFVVALPELRQLPSREFSRQLREHQSFGPSGANVTYVVQGDRIIHAVTYERGVENYTQACGTGAIAAAFFLNLREKTIGAPRILQMPGGTLEVSWNSELAILTGDARQICVGQLTKESVL